VEGVGSTSSYGWKQLDDEDLTWVNIERERQTDITLDQGSDTQVHTQKTHRKTQWVSWVHPPKKPTPKNPHFYFNLILVYTLYATKAFEALSYWVFVLFYQFFPACPKKPQNPIKPKKPTGLGFF